MKIKVKATVVKETVMEVPDHYDYDPTLRGRLVDLLLKRTDYISDTSRFRNSIHDGVAKVAEEVIYKLDRMYELADEIIALKAEET